MIETLKRLWAAGIAYVALLVGAGLSVAGNVADTFRTRGPLTDGLDIIMAAAWPILVLLTIELFVSRLWSSQWGFQALRWIGCLMIGLMAMLVSWVHLHDLLATRGQLTAVAIVGPLAIDGMAIMATGLLLSTRTAAPIVKAVATPVPDAMDVLNRQDEIIVDNWMANVETGARRQEQALVEETTTWLDSLAAGVQDTTTTPAAPVSGPPALARSNEIKPVSVPRLARLEILAGLDQGVAPGSTIATLAEAHGVSTRTGRRWRDAVLKG